MTAITKSVDLDRRGRVAVLTVNNPPVNALSQHVRQGLYEGLKQAISDSAVQAIVIVCAGRTFIAGADITEFGKPPAEPAARRARHDRELVEAGDRRDPR